MSGVDAIGDTPWEPPINGTEAAQVAGALDRLRWTFRWKADGLDVSGLAATIGASDLTLGRLLKHLAAVEDHYFVVRLAGESMPDAWAGHGWDEDPHWEFVSAGEDAPGRLYGLYDGAVARSRARLAEAIEAGGLDQPIHQRTRSGEAISLRRLLMDLIEEYGRHTGHADLLREVVDGQVGEDPPPGWRPVSRGSSA